MLNFMTVFAERNRFEELTKDFNLSVSGSSINTIEWFIEHGHRSNSLRNGFNEAMEIAKTIKEYADACPKDTGSGVKV